MPVETYETFNLTWSNDQGTHELTTQDAEAEIYVYQLVDAYDGSIIFENEVKDILSARALIARLNESAITED